MHFAVPVVYKERNISHEVEISRILEKEGFDWWGLWGRFYHLLEYFYLNKKFGFEITDLWMPAKGDLVPWDSMKKVGKEIKLTKGVRSIMERNWEYIFIIDGDKVYKYSSWKEVEKDYGKRFDTEEWKVVLLDCHI